MNEEMMMPPEMENQEEEQQVQPEPQQEVSPEDVRAFTREVVLRDPDLMAEIAAVYGSRNPQQPQQPQQQPQEDDPLAAYAEYDPEIRQLAATAIQAQQQVQQLSQMIQMQQAEIADQRGRQALIAQYPELQAIADTLPPGFAEAAKKYPALLEGQRALAREKQNPSTIQKGQKPLNQTLDGASGRDTAMSKAEERMNKALLRDGLISEEQAYGRKR